jgi:hypothetical protein
MVTWETKDITRGQTKQNSTTKKTVGAIKNWQSRDTGNMGNKRHNTRTNKTNSTTKKTVGAIKNWQSRDTGNNSCLPLQFSLLWYFGLFGLVWCLLFPMLPVSLDCQFLIVPTVFFVVEFVLLVLVLCLLFPMLPVSLDCQFLIAPTIFFVVEFCFVCPRVMSFVSHVVSVSRLSILDCPYSFLCCEILFCLSSAYVFCFPCCQCL